ncbi:hypothetical protein KC19_7G109900 [Ceratodon purpureus]|nr:hypothetical protein KC19_7G109900 [Ceratodon purpureus]
MVVPTKGVFLWKSGICLEGVVLRPSSITESTGRYFSVDEIGVAPVSAYSPLPTSKDEQGIVSTAEPLVYTGSSDSTPDAPILTYSPWPTSTNEQGIVSTAEPLVYAGSSDSTHQAPVLAYSPLPTSTDEQGIEHTRSSIGSTPEAPVWGYSAWSDDDSMPEAPVLGYSAWPILTDEQGIVRTTSPIDSTHEAPVLAYSSSPTSTDGQGFVNTAEPLIYTSSIDSTPEAPMLVSSSSLAFQSNFENGHSTIGTIPFYSSDLTIAIDSMSLVDQDAAVPSSAATDEHEELSYSLISDSAGIENEEAPFYTSGADDSRSKSPVGQSDSSHTEAPFYTDDDADVKVPFYTATGASDAGAQNKDHTLATSVSSAVSSSILTSSPQASSSDPFIQEYIELSAVVSTWNVESAENITTETDPRWYRFDNPPQDIVKGSDDWYYYTTYDCSTQTYYYPNGEAEFIGTPATDSSISARSNDDPSASSYTAKPFFDGSILNPTSPTSAETPSAGSLDLPVPERLLPCESGEQTFISGERILSTIDEWSRLPDVLVQQVLSLCGILDLHRLRAVCKRWNSLICSPHCRPNYPQEDARYIIGRCFDQHFEDASHFDIDGSRLVYIKVVGWKFYDLKEGRWYTWKPPGQHYSNLVSEAGMIVFCGSTTMAAANDHPLASEGGLVLCCSMLPGTATISELIIITNPMVMTKEVVLPLPVAWNNLYLSSFAVNLLVVDSSYKIFLINRYEDPFLCIFDSTINLWRISSNPPVRAWGQAESVTFKGHLYVLCRAREPPRRFWLLRYNYLEDSWADCGVNFPEWPDNGSDHKELVVSSDRLFVINGERLQLDTSNGVIRMLDPLTVFEIDLGDGTLVTECHLAKPLFQSEGLKVHGQSYTFFDSQLGECVDVKSFDFHRAFNFGTSIVLTYRWLAFSIVYNVETCLWKLFPTDPNVELYGNVMPLRPPKTIGEPIN